MGAVDVTIDAAGRILIPKPLRDALGLTAGSVVEVSRYGAGLQITPGGRTARIVEKDGRLVGVSDTTITDADVFALIDAGRK